MDAHAGSPKTYAIVLAALMTLTSITVAAAGIDFGSPTVNVVIALVIATLKASLVALFFMHLWGDKAMSAIILVSGLFCFSTFLFLTFLDEGSREVVRPSTVFLHTAPAAQTK
jgi:cytochrome c oxidase subunit IV